MSSWRIVWYASLVGVASHSLVRRFEPRFRVLVNILLSANLIILVLSLYLGVSVMTMFVKTLLMNSAFLSGLSVAIVAYRLSPWHPLARFPGPMIAKISKWYMSYCTVKGTRHKLLTSLHEQYGPWLRTGPNEISVNIPAAIRPIYSQCFRAPFYTVGAISANSLVSTIDHEEHAKRLVAWQKAFNTDALKSYRPSVQARTSQLIEILRRESKVNAKIDFSHWITLWSMDVMGDMAFAGGFEYLASGKDSEGWIKALQIGAFYMGVLGHVPWMRDMIAALPVPDHAVTFQKFAAMKVEETKLAGHGMNAGILGTIQDEGSGGPPLSKDQAAADAALIIVAGSDTTAQVVQALFRYILHDRRTLAHLKSEIDSAFDCPVEDMDALTLARLPYLDACIQETLRLAPPLVIGPPRYSGTNGVHILEKHIPPGTTLACPTYTLQRDPRNFKDPGTFIPERWIDKLEPHNTEAFHPFSYGLGVCVGKPVGLHNSKFLTASLLRTFDITLPKDFDVQKFDDSYKESNLWFHDPLFVEIRN